MMMVDVEHTLHRSVSNSVSPSRPRRPLSSSSNAGLPHNSSSSQQIRIPPLNTISHSTTPLPPFGELTLFTSPNNNPLNTEASPSTTLSDFDDSQNRISASSSPSFSICRCSSSYICDDSL